MKPRVLFLLAVLAVAGCSQTMPATPTVYPVRGTILLANGKPMNSGIVHLTPKDRNKALACDGRLKADGTFSIRTFVGPEGAVPGTYFLSIESVAPTYKEAAPTIPEKYTDPSTAEIIVEVKMQENDLGSITLK